VASNLCPFDVTSSTSASGWGDTIVSAQRSEFPFEASGIAATNKNESQVFCGLGLALRLPRRPRLGL
jgi:hypothetical protein